MHREWVVRHQLIDLGALAARQEQERASADSARSWLAWRCMDALEFRIEHDHPVASTDAGWVYAWHADGHVHYIGATWLHPAVRAEAHLHADTDDPRSLALRARAEGGTRFRIVAFAVPDGLDRARLKPALVDACRTSGILAPDAIAAVGVRLDHPTTAESAWLAEALGMLAAAVRSPDTAGTTARPDVRVHLLTHGGLMSPGLAREVETVAIEASVDAARGLGLDDVDVAVCDHPGLAIEELGVGGYSPGPHLVLIALEPRWPGFAYWRQHLPSTLRHELHHVRRHAGAGYGPTLLDGLVSEGSATLYEIECGGDPPYARVDVDLDAMWRRALPLLERTDQHPGWFFGGNDLPRWTGYTLGTELARRHAHRLGISAMELVDMPATEFPASW